MGHSCDKDRCKTLVESVAAERSILMLGTGWINLYRTKDEGNLFKNDPDVCANLKGRIKAVHVDWCGKIVVETDIWGIVNLLYV